MSATQYDVVIVGGGPNGAALALALAEGGLNVAIVEGKQPAQPDYATWDSRVYAISPGSRSFLDKLGAWKFIDNERVAPIKGMQVWGDDAQSHIEFDAFDIKQLDVGCILEAGLLQQALWCEMAALPSITVYCPAVCKDLLVEKNKVLLTLNDGAQIEASLIVGADGANSWVRQMADLPYSEKSYEQLAVVANFSTEKPHAGIARQWFREEGVIAWLPLPGNRISIVWSAEVAFANELLTLDDNFLCEKVSAAGNYELGELTLITKPSAFPLRLITLSDVIKPGIALIGDAAHVVHPLAGQGVNLGLRDAAELAQVLLAKNKNTYLGDFLLLRKYERARKEDWLATKWVTDGLHTLYRHKNSGFERVRNSGLTLVNKLPQLKKMFMQHAVL